MINVCFQYGHVIHFWPMRHKDLQVIMIMKYLFLSSDHEEKQSKGDVLTVKTLEQETRK